MPPAATSCYQEHTGTVVECVTGVLRFWSLGMAVRICFDPRPKTLPLLVNGGSTRERSDHVTLLFLQSRQRKGAQQPEARVHGAQPWKRFPLRRLPVPL